MFNNSSFSDKSQLKQMLFLKKMLKLTTVLSPFRLLSDKTVLKVVF